MTTYFFQAPQQNAEQIRQYNVFRSQVINEGWRTLDLWDYNTRVHVESVVSQRKVDRFEEEALFKKRYRHIIIRFGRCLRLPDSAQAPPSQNMVRASHFFGDVLYLRAGAYDHYMGIPKRKVVPGETKKEDVPEVPVLEIPVVVEQKESAVKEDTVTIQKVKATKKQAKKISSHQSSSCQHPRRKHRFGDFLDSSLFQAVPIQNDPEEATEEDIPEVLIPEISAMEHTTETQEKEVAKESTVESQEKEVVKKPVTKEHTVETQEKEIAKTHVVKENPDETLEVMKKPVAEENTVEPQGKDVVKKPVDEEQITKTQEKETMKKPVAKEHTLEPEEKEVVKKLITEERSVKTQEKRVVKKPAAKEHSVETKEKEVVKKPAKKILGDFLDSSLFQESRSKKSNQRKAEVPKKKSASPSPKISGKKKEFDEEGFEIWSISKSGSSKWESSETRIAQERGSPSWPRAQDGYRSHSLFETREVK
uniref:DRBM domain-containing protein n=1 Tax=Caenorhabditis tropicalis TaxID=1561998 RepID=A0A1I7UF46_9PELO